MKRNFLAETSCGIRYASSPTRTPSIVSCSRVEPVLSLTSTPTVYPPSSLGRTREAESDAGFKSERLHARAGAHRTAFELSGARGVEQLHHVARANGRAWMSFDS